MLHHEIRFDLNGRLDGYVVFYVKLALQLLKGRLNLTPLLLAFIWILASFFYSILFEVFKNFMADTTSASNAHLASDAV